jgi:hypothetical protein
MLISAQGRFTTRSRHPRRSKAVIQIDVYELTVFVAGIRPALRRLSHLIAPRGTFIVATACA